MNTWAKADILRLSIHERLQLMEAIWDSIADAPEELSLTDAQKAELDRRLAAYRENPDEGSPWANARERIQNRK